MRTSIALFTIIFAIFLSSYEVKGQHESSKLGHPTLGIGLGVPYSGLGARLGVNVITNTNLFASAGYNLVDIGYNFGLLYAFKSEKQAQFYLSGMYGTNASMIVEVEFGSDVKESFMGATFGAGLRINSLSDRGSYWDIGLMVPIRNSDYRELRDFVKNNADEFNDAWPVLITVGYNFDFSND